MAQKPKAVVTVEADRPEVSLLALIAAVVATVSVLVAAIIVAGQGG